MTQASHNCNQFTPVTSRREMLSTSATGFGMLALADLMSRQAAADATSRPINPLAPRDPHFPARAKRVIFLFMHGGPSQVETFDPKMTAPSGIRSATGEIKTAIPGVTYWQRGGRGARGRAVVAGAIDPAAVSTLQPDRTP